MSHFGIKYPKRAFILTAAKKKLGKEIVKGDPAWINGYFLQMPENKTSSLVRKSIMQEARKNYRGDKERAKIVFGE